MIMHDYNKDGKKIALLLHPMLASGKMMYEIIGKDLGEEYRILAPDFTSHGEEVKKEFVSANFEATEIIKYLKENNIDKLDFIYGASLGGVVLTEVIKQGIKFDKAFFEGTSFFENSKIMTKLLSMIFIKKHKRAVSDYDRAVNAMKELYGDAYKVDFAKQFISMSEDSIRNIAKACGNNVHANLSSLEQAKCTFSYGEKDFNTSKAKKSIKKCYPDAKLIISKGFDHCERIVKDHDNYLKMLKDYLN